MASESKAREICFSTKPLKLDSREVPNAPVHYRLRPIESVQFRFDNLGSHFE